MNIYKALIILLFCLPQIASALVVYQGGATEVEAPFTAPSATNSYSLTLTNEAGGDPAENFTGSFSGSEYTFLGGTFPGVGGNCPTAGALAAGSTCTVMIEFAPTSSGDNDDNLTINYETTDFLGTIARQLVLKIDGHAENSGVACPGLTPNIRDIIPGKLGSSTTATVRIRGGNFSPATAVTVSGLTVNSTTFINDRNIRFEVVTGATASLNDVTVTNECGSRTEVNGLEVSTTPWFDMRIAAQRNASNPVFTTAGISSFNINTNFGMQIDINSNGWDKFLRFDGVCGTISQNFDIVIYKDGNASRTMFSLLNAATQIEPYSGTNSWQRQYIGYWDAGNQLMDRVFGTQLGEGGVSWNQTFTATNIPDGGYYRFNFSGAGQNGQVMEIWSVDQNLDDIALLRSFTSNKPSTGATNVCPGVAPFDSGLSDFYITAVRVI